jgi:hypothetical protein
LINIISDQRNGSAAAKGKSCKDKVCVDNTDVKECM